MARSVPRHSVGIPGVPRMPPETTRADCGRWVETCFRKGAIDRGSSGGGRPSRSQHALLLLRRCHRPRPSQTRAPGPRSTLPPRPLLVRRLTAARRHFISIGRWPTSAPCGPSMTTSARPRGLRSFQSARPNLACRFMVPGRNGPGSAGAGPFLWPALPALFSSPGQQASAGMCALHSRYFLVSTKCSSVQGSASMRLPSRGIARRSTATSSAPSVPAARHCSSSTSAPPGSESRRSLGSKAPPSCEYCPTS